MKSLQGHFLLASPQLLDPNFARSVVLIVKHDEEGAIGVIVNRPLETTVGELCSEILETETKIDDVIYRGGPCDGPVMVLHADSELSQIQVSDAIQFTTQRDQIETLLRQESAPIKCFVGYAGWSPGQLEAEIETASWIVTPATARLIFESDGDLWLRLKTQISLSQWIDPKRIPDDPNMN